MKWFFMMVIILLAIPIPSVQAQDQDALENRLAYLNDIAEISWVEFDSNTVYVGFNKIPSDLSAIVRGAAAFGNKAYGFGVHVWAVPAGEKGWRPGAGSQSYCEATARYGKVQDCTCK